MNEKEGNDDTDDYDDEEENLMMNGYESDTAECFEDNIIVEE